MSLLRPGDARAGAVMSDTALLEAMLAVEDAWLRVRGLTGLQIPAGELADAVARGGEQAGNPVVPLVAELRRRLRDSGDDRQATAVHAGLTSQDVLDTALVLCARQAAALIDTDLRRIAVRLRTVAIEHRATLRAGRTLTQPAVPTNFGLVAATWLHGLLDAADALRRVRGLPIQLGGAAGTLAGPLTQGLADPTDALALALGLPTALPWHGNRAAVTRLGDALVGLHDACALVANDVLVGSRPEIGELREGAGGGSSTMPHKHNPVLSVLIRASAIAAPGLGATLHAAASAQVDQRADGGWHAEWPALATLTRSAVITVSQAADLVDGLEVDAVRMRANAQSHNDDLLAEARKLDADATALDDYLGSAAGLIDAVVARTDRYLEASR